MEPLVGLEPTTIRLQGECSTNWAKVASVSLKRHIYYYQSMESQIFCMSFFDL